jgi:hypothetical protein
LPQRWIGRTTAEDLVLLRRQSRSPDLTPHDSGFLASVPKDPPELRRRIIAAISEIDRDTLQRVWAEMDYRLDVCRVTRGGHIERLWGMQGGGGGRRRVSLSICTSHVKILSAIQVYRRNVPGNYE